jgi:hypothetical protein
MTPDQWRRAGELVQEALDQPLEARTAWAQQSCANDPEVHRELISLLDNDRKVAAGHRRAFGTDRHAVLRPLISDGARGSPAL